MTAIGRKLGIVGLAFILLTGTLFSAGVSAENGADSQEATEQGSSVVSEEKAVNNHLLLQGKLMMVNGELVITTATPQVVNGETFIPLRAVMEAFGVNWSIAGSDKAIINSGRESVTLKTVEIAGTKMVSLREAAEKLPFSFSTIPYPAYSSRKLSDAETKARNAYSSSLKAYGAALSKVKTAEANYQSAINSEPVFYISGEINSRDPFYVWGSAFSPNAAVNHPGWTGSSSTNILVKNPDSGKIAYGSYVMGVHYYIGRTTAKGRFGQDVPVFVFGGAPATVKKKLDQANRNLTAAKTQANQANKALENSKKQLIQTVKKWYDEKQKNEPKNGQIYLEYAFALVDTAVLLQESGDLLKLSEMKADKAEQLKSKSSMYYSLYLADQLEGDTRKNLYSKIADIDPAILINYAQSAEQFWVAGNALEAERQYKHAEYAYTQAKLLGSKDMKDRAEQKINKVRSAQEKENEKEKKGGNE
ncbi:stalk domain-containing protein [Paenibacillus sp. NPDC058071]|uniref:stalk domain-containing protein n=1 Tax=Paenibacillus sp. NPDC058071 TaxID=3346326 RepID=UPI0036D9B7EB